MHKIPKCVSRGISRPIRGHFQAGLGGDVETVASVHLSRHASICPRYCYLPSRSIWENVESTTSPQYRSLLGDEESSVERSFVPLFCFSVCPIMLFPFMSALTTIVAVISCSQVRDNRGRHCVREAI